MTVFPKKKYIYVCDALKTNLYQINNSKIIIILKHVEILLNRRNKKTMRGYLFRLLSKIKRGYLFRLLSNG